MKTYTQKVLLLGSIVAVAGMFVLPMVVNARNVEKSGQGTELSATLDGSSMVDFAKKAPKKKK